MPWCEDCSRFFNPNTLGAAGECPSCGRRLDDDATTRLAERHAAVEEAAKVPWHFWVMLAALTLYLGWRLLQGVDALWGWLF